ncbi:FecR domain-containing protein [Sphingobacterium oryzagri]|uniref:FecR domain-containing protein n=1 Tax=Sphingobacterium oryzagri TaxID=3025669 RepID=A0ABY7WDI2_9SPHI|nr:FecR domain-containing protein [Sphingobacterium sp. KACC 22765]WDF67562.1 FecR domain-containing protein [Sphingobacterium sp. KACC 22765]
MDKKDIAQLLQRYRNGEQLSSAEKQWLDSFYVYYAKKSTAQIADHDLDQQLVTVAATIKRGMSTGSKLKSMYRLAYAAAAVLAILSFGYYFGIGPFKQQQEVQLANGEMRQVVLEDGTKITLNASSKLIYPKSFKDADRREVTLTGEAYFDVAKNPNKPFLIHTPRMEIRVLGTSFNVRDYQNEQQAATALVHGRVEIWEAGKTTEKFILKPQEKFVLAESTLAESANTSAARRENTPLTKTRPAAVSVQPFTISEADGNAVETEWMFKRITIKDETLTQIALRLERMYGVKISINDKAVADQIYSATFDNERIEDVLKGLQTVAPFRYKKDAKANIEIYP